MQNNVTPQPRPRILAMRVRNTLRLPMPTRTEIVPIEEVPLFLALTRAVASRHQRGAVRAEPRVA